MKKLIIPVLLLCLLLTACGQVSPQVILNNSQTTTVSAIPPSVNPTSVPPISVTTIPTKESTSTAIIRPTTASTTAWSTSPPHPSAYFYTDSYVNYCEFIKSHETAHHIVLLEQLPYMGEFHSAIFVKSPESKEEINYSYVLKTVAGDQLSVLFLPLVNYEQRTLYPEKTDVSEFAKECLLTIDIVATPGYVRIKDVVYHYNLGKLTSICWAYEGYVIKIEPPDSWFDDIESTKNEPEFIQQLLNAETIEMAMQTFSAAVEAEAVK